MVSISFTIPIYIGKYYKYDILSFCDKIPTNIINNNICYQMVLLSKK